MNVIGASVSRSVYHRQAGWSRTAYSDDHAANTVYGCSVTHHCCDTHASGDGHVNAVVDVAELVNSLAG